MSFVSLLLEHCSKYRTTTKVIPVRKVMLSAAVAAALSAATFVAMPGTSQAAGPLPCDIYASGGTACVAAHSTTRALFAAYNEIGRAHV